jgi:hypothetical protein
MGLAILTRGLLVIVGAEVRFPTDAGKLCHRWRTAGRLSVDVYFSRPVDPGML